MIVIINLFDIILPLTLLKKEKFCLKLNVPIVN